MGLGGLAPQAVGGQIEIIVDGGIRRGTHVLKALALGATACSGGRMYLYALAGAGTAGVLRATALLRDELERDMKLMGCSRVADLRPHMVAQRLPMQNSNNPLGGGRQRL